MHGSSSTESFIPMSSIASGKGVEVAPDIYSYTTQIVNVCFIGNPDKENSFLLVDAGMPNSASMIIKEAEERFGKEKKLSYTRWYSGRRARGKAFSIISNGSH